MDRRWRCCCCSETVVLALLLLAGSTITTPRMMIPTVSGWVLEPSVGGSRAANKLLASRSSRGGNKLLASSSTTTIPTSTAGALSLPMDELAERLGGMGRARLVWDCYRVGIDPSVYFRESSSSAASKMVVERLLPGSRRTQRLGSAALERLDGLYEHQRGSLEESVARLGTVVTSADGTTKFLLRLAHDGTEVETVIIPWDGVRSTLCISSQVGCRQGCTFCATGKMGKVRSLSSDEILVQMFYARKLCRERNLPAVSNVVFMGMGEVCSMRTVRALLFRYFCVMSVG